MIVRGVRCCNGILVPHDFSERLKICNFVNDKKVSSRWVDVEEQIKIEINHFFGLWRFFKFESSPFFIMGDVWCIEN